MWLAPIPSAVSDLPGGQAASEPAGRGTQPVLGDGADGGGGERHLSRRLSTGAPPSLCCSHGPVGGLPAAPSLRGPCRAPRGTGPGGVCGWVSSPGLASRVGPSASGWLPPMRGAGGSGTAPEEGSDGLTRQNAGGPGHTTSFLQTSVSPSIKWAIPW